MKIIAGRITTARHLLFWNTRGGRYFSGTLREITSLSCWRCTGFEMNHPACCQTNDHGRLPLHWTHRNDRDVIRSGPFCAPIAAIAANPSIPAIQTSMSSEIKAIFSGASNAFPFSAQTTSVAHYLQQTNDELLIYRVVSASTILNECLEGSICCKSLICRQSLFDPCIDLRL